MKSDLGYNILNIVQDTLINKLYTSNIYITNMLPKYALSDDFFNKYKPHELRSRTHMILPNHFFIKKVKPWFLNMDVERTHDEASCSIIIFYFI